MKVLKRSQRNTILIEGESLFRFYHDSGDIVPIPYRTDSRGTRRLEHNHTPQSICTKKISPHLERARKILFECQTLNDVTRRCGVQPNTAWSYLCQLADMDASVSEHILNASFINPELLKALRGCDISGSLSSLMERLRPALSGCHEWRCEEGQYCQLRLARICMENL